MKKENGFNLNELGRQVKAFNDWLETKTEKELEILTNIINLGEEGEIEEREEIEQLKREIKEVNKLTNAIVKCRELKK